MENDNIYKDLSLLYNENKSFKFIIDSAIKEILTDLIVENDFDTDIIKMLYDITNDKMFKEIYNVMQLIIHQKTCPSCGGKFKFSGCPILVCRKCKLEYVIPDPMILKLCDYCVANKVKTCTLRQTIKNNIKDKKWETQNEDLPSSTEKQKLVNFSKEL